MESFSPGERGGGGGGGEGTAQKGEEGVGEGAHTFLHELVDLVVFLFQ